MLHHAYCLQLNEYETVPFFHQSKPKFDLDSLLIYVFCTTCVHEIVLSVLQIKRKTNFKFTIFTKHVNQQRICIDRILALIEERMELSCIHLPVQC